MPRRLDLLARYLLENQTDGTTGLRKAILDTLPRCPRGRDCARGDPLCPECRHAVHALAVRWCCPPAIDAYGQYRALVQCLAEAIEDELSAPLATTTVPQVQESPTRRHIQRHAIDLPDGTVDRRRTTRQRFAKLNSDEGRDAEQDESA